MKVVFNYVVRFDVICLVEEESRLSYVLQAVGS